MKKIKVIDLLNKIANGEKVPEKIKWGDHNLTWCIYEHKALDELDDPNLFKCAGGNISRRLLNDEVEIIEDTPKEIYFDEEDIKAEKEEMKKLLIEKKDNFYDYYKEDKKIEKLDVVLLGQCDNWLQPTIDTDEKIRAELNPYIIDVVRENTLVMQRKINEIIDKVNGE